MNELENMDNKYDDFYYTELTPAVVKFNTICFGDFQELSLEDKAKAVNLQLDIINQEMVEEYRRWYAVDMVEELDAIADTLFTIAYLHYQCEVIETKLSKEDQAIINDMINIDKMELLFLDFEAFLKTFLTHFDLDIVIDATRLVIKNNEQKYTDSLEYFNTWESPSDENLSRKSLTFGDKEYYLFVNENGKVRKKVGFEGVDLRGLVGLQLERFEDQLFDDEDLSDDLIGGADVG